MPRKAGKVPAYCLHKRSGRAVVRIGGQDHYLGPYGTPESHERYERAIAQWRADQAAGPTVSKIHHSSIAGLTISKVLLAFAEFAKNYYCKDGQVTKEFGSMLAALRPLRALFGSTPASEFGPKRLTQVREKMIADGLSRGVTNARINRIKRFFKMGCRGRVGAAVGAARPAGGPRIGVRSNNRTRDGAGPASSGCLDGRRVAVPVVAGSSDWCSCNG